MTGSAVEHGVLAGLVVVEHAGSVTAAACANLLASLGAHVLRVESPREAARIDTASAAERVLRAAGKTRLVLDPASPSFAVDLERVLDRGDVVIVDGPAGSGPADAVIASLLEREPGDRIVCAITPLGLDARGAVAPDAGDAALQALGGILATTGAKGGPPVSVGVPLVQMCAGVSCASAVLAALAVRRVSGHGQLIDMALVETIVDHLRSHMGLIQRGTAVEYRLGCGHPGVAPWNAYRASDGWVLICTAADAQWRALCDLMQRRELGTDPRYATNDMRRENVAGVDAIMAAWVGSRTCAEVIAAIEPIDVPVGPVASIAQVVADPALRARGMVRDGQDAQGRRVPVAGSVLRLSRTPGAPPLAVAPARAGLDALPAASTGPRPPPGALRLPFAGIRVVEVSRYAAGPSCGQVLAALGAEVIKVEGREGEDCRVWEPAFGGISGYFANYNSGKRAVTLDLRSRDDVDRLWTLVESADVFLQNLKPGSLDRMGLGQASVRERFPRLVYASISGYGEDGARIPGLDTVLQGRGGLIALVGGGDEPLRVGVSTADLMSGQFCALGIMAALAERERSGRGQLVDISMYDTIAWLTQLAWPDGRHVIGPWATLQASDGYVLVETATERARELAAGCEPRALTREALADHLRARGASACPVLDPVEAIFQPALAARGTVIAMPTADGAHLDILRVPLGLRTTPPRRDMHVPGLGQDNEALFGSAIGRPTPR
jgi:crotonobetainyl-CoA:carnitine CoA-transferase CaiB-like acyl-CoA transferase